MSLYFVAYDLDKPGQNYPNLWNGLESLHAKRVRDSVWALNWTGGAQDLFKVLHPHIDSNDRLLVIASGGSWWVNLMTDPKQFL